MLQAYCTIPTLLLVLLSPLVPATVATGQVIASDSAADIIYTDGWQAGDNGGFGFAPWWFGLGNHYIGSSTTNGFSPPSGGIDTNGVSWGVETHGGLTNTHLVRRDFLSPLASGAVLQFQFDLAGRSGFRLDAADGTPTMIFDQYSGFGTFDGSGGNLSANLPVHFDGYTVLWQQIDASHYRMRVGSIAGSFDTGVRSLYAGSPVGITFYNNAPLQAPINTFFVNDLRITIPEPEGAAVSFAAFIFLLGSRLVCRWV